MSDASLGSALRGAVDLSSLRNRPASPGAGAPGAPQPGQQNAAGSAPDVVMHVDDQSFGHIMELSATYPVVVQLWADQVPETVSQGSVFETVTRTYGGRLILARVDATRAPQVAQMFQQNGWPMTVGVIGQRPVPFPEQEYTEQQVRDVFDQILQLAENAGVTGTLDVADEPATDDPQEKPLPPLHQEAFDAIQRGDYVAAIAAYEKALKANPRDEEAQAGLGQVRLLNRVDGVDLHAARQAAADAPDDVAAQLQVADLDVAGGHVDDAFDRLLDLFARLAGDARTSVKDRLVEYFGVVGQADPRVISARTRLTSLLF
ncbi:tetratricopeptide repeat protein [Microbacterium sp. G2-8]|uniref:tetratricopeptide repeat protein n=1 Tax=Microbacterium sp. G2-8 TaxID=2842454 RepID=UPI001C89113C|nr:tetratricopeptide repeat protein [Microbacterium sp. G2-8]